MSMCLFLHSVFALDMRHVCVTVKCRGGKNVRSQFLRSVGRGILEGAFPEARLPCAEKRERGACYERLPSPLSWVPARLRATGTVSTRERGYRARSRFTRESLMSPGGP